jgi:hypothetical protein
MYKLILFLFSPKNSKNEVKDEANCTDVGYDKFMKAFKMDFDEIETLRRQLNRVFKVENNLFCDGVNLSKKE